MMDQPENYDVVLFNCVSHAIKAEKVLKATGLTFKIIPVPRHISSDCGVCLRIDSDQEERIRTVLVHVEGFTEIVAL